RALVEAECIELLLVTELEREELVDEGDVVVELAHLEDLLPPEPEPAVPALLDRHVLALVPLLAEPPLVPAVLDVAQELDAELVGIELPGRRRQNTGIRVGIIDDLGGLERLLRHDLRMPERGPSFIHYLRLPLRREVIGLGSNDLQHIAIPALERRVLDQEQQ